MKQQITETITLETVVCCTCGTVYAMQDELRRECRRNGQTFYCPNGHAQIYGRTTEDELKEANRRLSQTEFELMTEKNMHRATKGQVTKLKKWIANGVCPCCHRQFVNLARHMEGQHPDFIQEEGY